MPTIRSSPTPTCTTVGAKVVVVCVPRELNMYLLTLGLVGIAESLNASLIAIEYSSEPTWAVLRMAFNMALTSKSRKPAVLVI